MKVQDELARFDAEARVAFDRVVEEAERFLVDHHSAAFELSVAVAQWRGTPALDRQTEQRALAIVDALRSLHQLVAAGVEADRQPSGDEVVPA